MNTRGLIVALVLAVMATSSASSRATVAPASPACIPRVNAPAAGRLTLIETKSLDARTTDLTLHSPAMQRDVHVNVMLPVGYNPRGGRRYPVLYLLHGALGGYMNWFTDGHVEKLIGRRPLIVVMPDGGYDGSYSDWYGLLQGQSGPVPAWETFHVHELIPYIDLHYPTLATRGERFIAGLSAGGGGSTHYAADNPGLFGAVGSFSGANDNLEQYPFYPTLSEGLWLATDAPGDGPDGHCTWGDPYTQRVVWEDNDPTYLAPNLRATPLWIASGNGEPGPLDPTPTSNAGQDLSNAGGEAAAAATEMEIWDMTRSFVRALNGAGIPHADYFYGPGTHSWPYWRRDLKRFLSWLAPYIGHPVPAPGAFSYRTANTAFSAWGWRFNVSHRDVREFVYLTGIRSAGLDARGSGTLSVTTAPLYPPGQRYVVDADARRELTRADRTRRLHFTVELGPSHRVQQYGFGPGTAASWQATTVTIRRRWSSTSLGPRSRPAHRGRRRRGGPRTRPDTAP
jgi:S-formylglutathione hydrolase FrmB